jgi:hypothetical protein
MTSWRGRLHPPSILRAEKRPLPASQTCQSFARIRMAVSRSIPFPRFHCVVLLLGPRSTPTSMGRQLAFCPSPSAGSPKRGLHRRRALRPIIHGRGGPRRGDESRSANGGTGTTQRARAEARSLRCSIQNQADRCNRFISPASSNTGTFSSCAFSSFDPASAPAIR